MEDIIATIAAVVVLGTYSAFVGAILGGWRP